MSIMVRHFSCVTLFLLPLLCSMAISQINITGQVKGDDGTPLAGANVFIEGTSYGSAADSSGRFVIDDLQPGSYLVVATFVGYANATQRVSARERTVSVDFILESDLLAFREVVVTGVFNKASKLNSSVAVSTLNSRQISQRHARGTGDLLTAVPGNAIDMGGGEVGAQVYPRGLSTGAVADIGFKYSSLQEDGLPVMSTQFQFAVIDMFHRPDATVARLEAIRGGSSSISTANSPGGIFNFISRTGTPDFGGIARISSGTQGDGNVIIRADLDLGGPLSHDGWLYNIGGFYRFDEGARNLPFTANKGGQLKANLTNIYKKGLIKFYGKALNDQVIFYKQLPVTSLEDPQPFPGFDLNSSSLIVDANNDDIPSAADPAITRSYHADDGIGVQHYALGFQVLQQLGKGWELNNNLKYGYFDFDHFQSSGHNLLPTALAPNRIHGLPNEQFNSYSYRDMQTGEVLAQFQDGAVIGENQLGDKVLLTLGKTVTYQVHDVIDQLSFSKGFGSHQLTAGTYFGFSDIRNTLNLDFVLGRFEPNPRLLLLTHPNPYASGPADPQELTFTDPRGYFAYGFGTYTNFSGSSRIHALFLNDIWEADEKLRIDIGARFEFIHHQGTKEVWDILRERDPATGLPLGPDGDFSTFYDNFYKFGTGRFFNFDFDYSYGSGSLGLNYQFRENMAAYARLTRGVKAPETTYYINNFVNIDFEKGFEEEILQSEIGLKVNSRLLSLFLTGFYSRLNNVPFQILVVSGDIGQFTPATFNSTRTLGTEIEAALRPVNHFNLDIIATFQNPRFIEFEYYNINRTGADFSDDFTEKFDGNTINEVPSISFDFTPSYQQGILNAFVNWRYLGKRYANRRNTLTLPAFGQFNAGVSLKFAPQFSVQLNVNNIFNSAGLMNFEGVGIPGTTGEDVTPELIENVIKPQNRPYFVRPILPRSVTVTLSSSL